MQGCFTHTDQIHRDITDGMEVFGSIWKRNSSLKVRLNERSDIFICFTSWMYNGFGKMISIQASFTNNRPQWRRWVEEIVVTVQANAWLPFPLQPHRHHAKASFKTNQSELSSMYNRYSLHALESWDDIFTDRRRFDFHLGVEFLFLLDKPIARANNELPEMKFIDDTMKKDMQTTLVFISFQCEQKRELQISHFRWSRHRFVDRSQSMLNESFVERSQMLWWMEIRDIRSIFSVCGKSWFIEVGSSMEAVVEGPRSFVE